MSSNYQSLVEAVHLNKPVQAQQHVVQVDSFAGAGSQAEASSQSKSHLSTQSKSMLKAEAQQQIRQTMKASIRYVGDVRRFMHTELAEAKKAVQLSDAATETWRHESAAVEAATSSNGEAAYGDYMKASAAARTGAPAKSSAPAKDKAAAPVEDIDGMQALGALLRQGAGTLADSRKLLGAHGQVEAKDDAKKDAKAEDKKEEKSPEAKEEGKDDAKAEGDGEADKVAADADKEKADKLKIFAKHKVDSLVDHLGALDGHIKEQFGLLEKILSNTEIEADFDPTSQEDLEWVVEEILKILEDTPEIKQLEDKLGVVKKSETQIGNVVKELNKITDFSKMLEAKDEKKGKADKAKAAEGGKAEEAEKAEEEEKKAADEAKKDAEDAKADKKPSALPKGEEKKQEAKDVAKEVAEGKVPEKKAAKAAAQTAQAAAHAQHHEAPEPSALDKVVRATQLKLEEKKAGKDAGKAEAAPAALNKATKAANAEEKKEPKKEEKKGEAPAALNKETKKEEVTQEAKDQPKVAAVVAAALNKEKAKQQVEQKAASDEAPYVQAADGRPENAQPALSKKKPSQSDQAPYLAADSNKQIKIEDVHTDIKAAIAADPAFAAKKADDPPYKQVDNAMDNAEDKMMNKAMAAPTTAQAAQPAMASAPQPPVLSKETKQNAASAPTAAPGQQQRQAEPVSLKKETQQPAVFSKDSQAAAPTPKPAQPVMAKQPKMDPNQREEKILEVRKRDGDLDNAISQLEGALHHGERKKVDVPEAAVLDKAATHQQHAEVPVAQAPASNATAPASLGTAVTVADLAREQKQDELLKAEVNKKLWVQDQKDEAKSQQLKQAHEQQLQKMKDLQRRPPALESKLAHTPAKPDDAKVSNDLMRQITRNADLHKMLEPTPLVGEIRQEHLDKASRGTNLQKMAEPSQKKEANPAMPSAAFAGGYGQGPPTEYPPVSLNKEPADPVLPSEALSRHLQTVKPAEPVKELNKNIVPQEQPPVLAKQPQYQNQPPKLDAKPAQAAAPMEMAKQQNSTPKGQSIHNYTDESKQQRQESWDKTHPQKKATN